MPKVSAEHTEQRRRQVLDAALRCFEREGFHRTSMADVIAESGLSAGSVYRYFTSKNQLIHACAQLVLGELSQGVAAALAERGALTPAEVVEQALEAATGLGASLGVDPTRVALSVWAEGLRDAELRGHLGELYGSVVATFAATVRDAQRAGVAPAGADADDVARAMLGAVMGFVVQRIVLGGVEPGPYTRGLVGLGGGVAAPTG